jgi:hypothetical protein
MAGGRGRERRERDGLKNYCWEREGEEEGEILIFWRSKKDTKGEKKWKEERVQTMLQ